MKIQLKVKNSDSEVKREMPPIVEYRIFVGKNCSDIASLLAKTFRIRKYEAIADLDTGWELKDANLIGAYDIVGKGSGKYYGKNLFYGEHISDMELLNKVQLLFNREKNAATLRGILRIR